MGYERILLKLSGEALLGERETGIDPATLARFAREIAEVRGLGKQLAVLMGGGNLFRGADLADEGYDRGTADYMGMLATVLNGLALMDLLERIGETVRLVSSLKMEEVAEPYIRRRCIRHLEKGRIVVLTCGLGRPFFSTDTAAVQRALEIGADVVFKGTRVKGVYDRDPEQFPDAKFYEKLSFEEAMAQHLNILDQAAFALCRDNDLPLLVFNIFEPGNLLRAAQGESVGTLVKG